MVSLQEEKGHLQLDTAATKSELMTLQLQLKQLQNETATLRSDAATARQAASVARAQSDKLEREAREVRSRMETWRGQISQASVKLQNAANALLTDVFNDNPAVVHNQINQARLELKTNRRFDACR